MSHDPHPPHRPGRAALIVIALLVVATVTGAFLLFRQGRDTASTPTPAAPDPAREERELTQFQEALDAAMQGTRDARPLIAQGRTLTERYPQSAPVRVSYAMALMATGQAEAAYSQFAEAIKLDPSDAETQSLAGALATQLQRSTDALRHFSQAVGLEPANPQHRLRLAAAYARAGQNEEARSAFLEALRLDSSLHQARYGLAELYASQNKINLALDQIAGAIELVPVKDETTRELYLRKQAGYLRRDNRAEEALAILQSLPAKSRITPTVCEDLATTWMMLGRPADAAYHYEQVLQIDLTAEWAAERAAFYRLKAGDREKAATNLATLRRINPRSPHIAELEKALNS